MIVDALGYARDKSGFASVSRSLARLCKAGKVTAYQPSLLTRGKGARYCLAPENKPKRKVSNPRRCLTLSVPEVPI